MTNPTINPSQDGIDHINVYSKGKSELGRLLTNFAFTPFKHPKYGHFASMEAFWYWLGTGMQHNKLRCLYGTSAKNAGRLLERVEHPNFKEEISEAIRFKLQQTPEIVILLMRIKPMPLAHYYVYGVGENARVINKPEHTWQLLVMEKFWQDIYAKAHPNEAD